MLNLCIIKELLEQKIIQDFGIGNVEILENDFYTLRCSIEDEEKLEEFCNMFVALLEETQLIMQQLKHIHLQEISTYVCECCNDLFLFIKLSNTPKT